MNKNYDDIFIGINAYFANPPDCWNGGLALSYERKYVVSMIREKSTIYHYPEILQWFEKQLYCTDVTHKHPLSHYVCHIR